MVMSNEMLLNIQCILFLLLNVLDGISTWLVMKPNHYDRERNPIARWFFRKLQAPFSIMLFKVIILSGLGVFIAYWWKEALTINIGLLIGNLLFFFVVKHNFYVYYEFEAHKRRMQMLQQINGLFN